LFIGDPNVTSRSFPLGIHMSTCTIFFGGLLAAVLMFVPVPAHAEILHETGTLRGFLAGECPGCAYDNWISRISEGIARPGYNAYAPALLDPQLNGFGGFQLLDDGAAGDSLLAVFADGVALLLEGDGAAAALRLEATPGSGYQLVQLADSSMGRDFWLLREPLDSTYVDPGLSPGPQDDVVGGFARGWGVFVVNPAATRPEICVQMPHPCDDFPTPYLGLEAFLELDAGLLMIHGAGREVAYTGSAASYTNSVSLSDPSRNCRLPFAEVHKAFLAHVRASGNQELVIQLHSYDDASHRNLTYSVVTAGPSNRLHHPPLFETGCGAKGLLGNLGQPVLSANALGWSHPELRLQDYVSSNSQHPLWLETGLPDSLVQLPTTAGLPGYGANCQLLASYGANYPECDRMERILHIEVDELPAPAHAMGSAAFHGCGSDTVVARLANFILPWETFRPLVVALRTARDSLADFDDLLPPQAPIHLAAVTAGATSIRLNWGPARSVGFDTYEVRVDTAWTQGPTSFTRTRSQISTLCYPALRTAEITGLVPGTRYTFSLLARDDQGRTAACPDTVRHFLVDTVAPQVALEARSLVPAGEPGAIRARVTDHSPLAQVVLRFSLDSLSWEEEAMGLVATDRYEGWLPALPEGGGLWYQVWADDGLGGRTAAASPVTRLEARRLVGQRGFDDCDGASHEAFGGGTDPWRRDGCASVSGSAWRAGGASCGVYPAHSAGWLTLDPLVLPEGLTQPLLSIWTRMEAEAYSAAPDSCYDGGLFQLRLPGGEWADVASIPPPTHSLRMASQVPLEKPRRLFSGSTGWQEVLVPLPEGAVEVELRAGFVSDASVQKAGWVLDEVALWGTLPPDPPQLRLDWQDGALTLAWEAVPGATGYRVETRDGLEGAPWSSLGFTPGNAWTLAAPPPEGVALFRVVALGVVAGSTGRSAQAGRLSRN